MKMSWRGRKSSSRDEFLSRFDEIKFSHDEIKNRPRKLYNTGVNITVITDCLIQWAHCYENVRWADLDNTFLWTTVTNNDRVVLAKWNSILPKAINLAQKTYIWLLCNAFSQNVYE